MKILLFGVQPYGSAGVPNYTRPLGAKFSELGHEVTCFHSGAYENRYNWLVNPYLRINSSDFPYEYAELINSPCWITNFGQPDLDINQHEINAIFKKYLEQKKPDVMHVNGFTGLPMSLVRIASEIGIKVFITHHVYWPLCQKQVMIDYKGLLCLGPVDLEKCSICTGRQDIKKMMLLARIRNTCASVVSLLSKIKKLIKKDRTQALNATPQQETSDVALSNALKKRLEFMVTTLNEHVVTNICVSTDVKKILMRFGVRDEKLQVLHIGSSIAEHLHITEKNQKAPIVIGNIGGVHHYKGTHVLIEAASKVKNRNFKLKIFGKYCESYFVELSSVFDLSQIEFTGKYVPDDLPGILSQIDVMVLPSICNDTAPQTIFESFSGGTPIIASNIGGFPDFITDGINGNLFTVGDSDELAQKIDYLLDNPDVIQRYRRNIPKLKTISENALELIELYQSTNSN